MSKLKSNKGRVMSRWTTVTLLNNSPYRDSGSHWLFNPVASRHCGASVDLVSKSHSFELIGFAGLEFQSIRHLYNPKKINVCDKK